MSMISSTPLPNSKVKIMDSTISDVSLTPILYDEIQKDPKTPLLRTQYDRILAKSNNGKLFRQVKLNDKQEVSTDDTEEIITDELIGSTESQQTPRSILKKNSVKDDELVHWRTNPTKYAELLFDSKVSKKSKFNSSLPYDEEYLPSDEFGKKIFKYKKEVGDHHQHHLATTNNQQILHVPKKESTLWANTYLLISDPSIPYTLSLYLQLLLNAVIIGFIILFMWTFVSTIRNDIKKRTDEMTFKLLKEISVCSKEYDRNNCHPSIRVPAADKACSVWEHCMNQDPTSVGQVKISFEILAEILNSFVKLLSWKTIFVLMLLMIGSLVVTNLVFDRYRYNYQVGGGGNTVQQSHLVQDNSYSQYKSPYTSMVRKDMSFQSPSVRFSDYNGSNRKKWE